MLSIRKYKFKIWQLQVSLTLKVLFKIHWKFILDLDKKTVPIPSLRTSEIYAALIFVTTKHPQSCLSYVPLMVQTLKLVTGTCLWPVCVKGWHCQCVLCSNLVIWHGPMLTLTTDAPGTPGCLDCNVLSEPGSANVITMGRVITAKQLQQTSLPLWLSLRQTILTFMVSI